MFYLSENISCVKEENLLVVLDFNTGNYYKLTGLVVDIMLLIGNKRISIETIRNGIAEIYSDKEFLIDNSISYAISMLKEKGFVLES